MTLAFVSAFLVGLAYCAAPGVINAESVRRAARHGFSAGLQFQLGALAGDALWVVLAFSGAAALAQHVVVQTLLHSCGGAMLLWMGWQALRDGGRERRPGSDHRGRRNGLLMGLLLSVANPFAVTFWLSVGAGLLARPGAAPTPGFVAASVGGFVAATLLWSFALSALAARGRGLAAGAGGRWCNLAVAGVLLLFGLGMLWETVARIVVV